MKNLKFVISTMAHELKNLKSELKSAQRSGQLNVIRYKQEKLLQLKYECRHHHIAASLLRGTAYENVESPRMGNAPNFSYVKTLQEKYDEKIVYSDAV